ncbi:Pyridoxal phosphate transferases superfamily protein [Perilla frutescens var. hirtella]|nr:Pyridoxal phosphate transferases superfamily protein [Perilla frutescens var. frutescens]KAH6775802.1 Pyridoxal phosphate transferases superfamily protein [Perilla frutescens var. hirtella]
MGSLENQKPEIKPLEPEEFRRQAHLVIDFLADYYKNVENYPVRSQVAPGYLKERIPESAPIEPEPIEDILRDVRNDIIPGLTHWQSPNFYGYFPCNVSIAGILGEMLCTGFNVPGFNWISSPAATELESTVIDWIGKMLQLPADFLFSGGGGGVIQGTTCEAILSTLVAAREKKLKGIGSHNVNKLVVYGSDQTHSAFQKAAQIAGIHPSNFRAVTTRKADAFALTAEALREIIESDIESGLVPLFLCASVGTTASTAVDQVGALGAVAKEYGIWVHVDGAYAVSACICPEFRHFMNGVENTDSLSFNPHKWFFTGLDCCCLWVKNPTALVKALSTNPEFLRNKTSQSNQVVDYKDWQITLSRRFRSIKLWLVLRSYGVANLRKLIRNHVRMAKDFEGLVRMDVRFQVVVPRNFSTVCFRISPLELGGAADDLNAQLLESINESGKVFMTHAVVGGVFVVRFAIGASLTQNRHIKLAWKVVQEHADSLLLNIS